VIEIHYGGLVILLEQILDRNNLQHTEYERVNANKGVHGMPSLVCEGQEKSHPSFG